MSIYVPGEKDLHWLRVMDEHGRSKSTCNRGHNACLITDNFKDCQLGIGAAGVTQGMASCDEAGHDIVEVTYPDGEVYQHCYRTIHCEKVAGAQFSRLAHGIAPNSCWVYCNLEPCHVCAAYLVENGFRKFIFTALYHSWSADRGREILDAAGSIRLYTNKKLKDYLVETDSK